MTTNNKSVTFRPTLDAQTALESLVKHYQKEFSGIKQSDVINKAIVELWKQLRDKETHTNHSG